MGVILGSARVSRAGDGVLAIANFSYVFDQASHEAPRKFVSARRRNQHARRMRYLIIDSKCSVLAAESGAASVSYALSEWALVWV
jgi:hypothetical protein